MSRISATEIAPPPFASVYVAALLSSRPVSSLSANIVASQCRSPGCSPAPTPVKDLMVSCCRNGVQTRSIYASSVRFITISGRQRYRLRQSLHQRFGISRHARFAEVDTNILLMHRRKCLPESPPKSSCLTTATERASPPHVDGYPICLPGRKQHAP